MSRSGSRVLVAGIGLVVVALATVSHLYPVAARVRAQGGQPILPMRLFGAVQVDGQQAAAGVLVTAAINQVVYAATTTTVTGDIAIYVLDVPGDDPNTQGSIEGGRAGDPILFTVNNVRANETTTWQSGAINELNLTTSTVPTPVTPTVTPVTPTPTATPRPVTPMSIPEPLTGILFGIGLASLAALRAGTIRIRR